MLSAIVINVNNSLSQYSRNVYVTWKKSRKSLCLKCGNKERNSIPKTSSHSHYYVPSRRKAIPQDSSIILLHSAKHVYLSVRTKCTWCIRSAVHIPKRYASNGRQSWKIVLRQAITSVHHYLPIRLQVANSPAKFKPHQHSKMADRDCLVYFSETFNSESQAELSNISSPSTSDDNKLDNKEGEVISTTEHTNPNEVKVQSNIIENEVDVEEKKQTNIKSKMKKYSTGTNIYRSQYEHLTTALSSQAEAEKKSYEKSIFMSVKSIFEAPVNGFFSFMSRTNLFEPSQIKENFTEKVEENVAIDAKEVDKLSESNEVPPPPPSMLDTLYQYIPYVLPVKAYQQNTSKESLEKKEESRIQAEKDHLMQRMSINNRTRYLIQAIRDSNSLSLVCQHVEELNEHLLRYPDTRITAVKANAIKEIMHIYRTTFFHELMPTLRMTLAMLGAVDPPKQKGIRVLSIDGGGSRGVVSVEIFRRLVELSGRPIHEMFDYICGVSTGAILGFLLGIQKVPIDDLGNMYREMSSEIFSQNRIVGTGTLVLSHAYYNTDTYQKVLKEVFGDTLLIETAAYEDVPKCSAVSTLVNRLALKPFVWRNYSIVPGTRHTQWSGTCRAGLWEAIRASSAAPGYFEEFKKGQNIHQDGGVLTNNPTGVALNECRLLWPNAPIQCVVSVGTGRYEPTVGPMGEDFSSLKDKILKFVDSATSVTEVHTVMNDLLPTGTYFRFNPFIQEPLLLDECRTERLDMLVDDANVYIERNGYKFKACVDTLLGNTLPNKRIFM